MMGEEESFPRGGKVVRKRPHKDADSLFAHSKPPKTKKPKKSKKQPDQESSGDIFEATLNIKGTLSYSKVQTGMIVLGCVRHISNFGLEVELPGLCFASIAITEISDPFTKYLNQQLENNEEDPPTLKNLFTIGEFLPVKITNIETNDKGVCLSGSINPREIYSELNHNSFKKEMLVWACINSKADHGYEVSMGVKNCRAFLPFKNVDQELEYVTGKPMWCTVHKSDSTDSMSIIRLSAKSEHLRASKCNIENIHSIIPGTKVEFITDKITPHGIQGKFNGDFIGYVEESFLLNPLKTPSHYQEGKILKAFVLYVEPVTNITYLTLRVPEIEDKPDLNTGEIIKAEVLSKSNNGVFFLLPSKRKGFASNKRLIKCISHKQDADDIQEAINSKFSVGSSHNCRILDYNHMWKTYICTPEVSVVKEKVFSVADLTAGQLVSVKVVSVKEEGIVVSTGHVQGFVPNVHISNSEYTNNVKKKFKEDQTVDARVLSIKDEKVLLTLKQSLIENDDCLINLDDAEVGKRYMGVVSSISDKRALVVFYNDVKGWLGLGKDSNESSRYFFLGQVVNVYVSRKNEANMRLSLFPPKEKSKKPNVGGKYTVLVRAIRQEGVKVQIENSTNKGLIPDAHLSTSLSLCQAFKKTLVPGDKMVGVMFLGESKSLIFSRREGLAAKSKSVPCVSDLSVGSLIRSFYQETSAEGVHVLPLLQDFSGLVTITEEHMDTPLKDLKQHQLLWARVKAIDRASKKMVLSVKLMDVFDNTVESVLNTFSIYLTELAYIYKRAKKLKWNICKFKVGEKVQGIVEKIGPRGGCVVSLEHDVKGIAETILCPKSLKLGDSVTCVVIAQNFVSKIPHLEVCIRPDLCEKINPVQDGDLQECIVSGRADRLLMKDEYIVGLLRHPGGNQQLVYLPARLHENDFEKCYNYYDKKKFKVSVCGKIKKFLVGVSTKLFLFLDKSSNRHRLERTQYNKVQKSSSKRDLKVPTSKGSVIEGEANGLDSDIEQEGNNTGNEIEIESDVEPSDERKHENAHSTSVVLPGISSFFNIRNETEHLEESSSEDENNGPSEKKKKLSPAERTELIRQEEERISRIEKELADPTKDPESAEQFDRLVLAKPDSGELWAKYVAFHIAATEIDKARAVAKRALETINMTLTEEKFSIWMILLNLENSYGTRESFDESFEEALKFNDPLQVYLKVISMLADSSKYTEMEEKINRVRGKFKQDPKMWQEIAKTYYQIGKFKEARNCKDRALKSIADKKSQMSVIVRFGIMEFKFGEPDQGAAIFETILTTDPKRVNVWITYVDQLVKKGQIDEARHVLERSVSHKLPLKSMKSLFMKFRKFEESHGTVESVEAVKQRAQKYVDKFGNA